MAGPELDDIGFDEAVKKLETIVRKLEAGKESLENSLELYEEGIALVKYCSAKISNAEKRVKILTSGNGNLTETDFD